MEAQDAKDYIPITNKQQELKDYSYMCCCLIGISSLGIGHELMDRRLDSGPAFQLFTHPVNRSQISK
jgi:hypothetical protein